MNCKKYESLISPFLDGVLDETESRDVESHLKVCTDCARLHEDFAAILSFSAESLGEDESPPNPQALWCRINNIIETEVEAAGENSPEASVAAAPGRVTGFLSSSWRFSPGQAMVSLVAVALVSSLLTIVGVKKFSAPPEIHGGIDSEPSAFESILARVGFAETAHDKNQRRIREQKSAIAYWEKRVELRKVQWDSHLQQAFDRNLKQINKAVDEYTKILQEDPKDSISTEMLDSALSEKMEFLREFAEL